MHKRTESGCTTETFFEFRTCVKLNIRKSAESLEEQKYDDRFTDLDLDLDRGLQVCFTLFCFKSKTDTLSLSLETIRLGLEYY